jgi:feruloyl esterase
MYPDPSNLSVAVLTPQAQQFMGEAVLAQCDLLDGIDDGVLNNPLECEIDVDDFACADGQADACLTPAQVEAARRVYEGLVINGEQVWPGFAPGAKIGEAGWTRWVAGGLAATAGGEFQEGVPVNQDLPVPAVPNLTGTIRPMISRRSGPTSPRLLRHWTPPTRISMLFGSAVANCCCLMDGATWR